MMPSSQFYTHLCTPRRLFVIFVVLAHLEDHEATFCGRQEARTPPNTLLQRDGDGNEGIGWDGM